MLFLLFSMFDDYWRIHCQSQDSAGKGLSRHHISEDQQFSENTQKFLFGQMTEVARRRGRGEPPGSHTTHWRGPVLGHAARWCGRPGPPLPVSLRVYRLPENLRLGGAS
jgi:hypothetical protein